MNKNINTNRRVVLYTSIYPAIEKLVFIDDGTIGVEHLKKRIV